MPRSETRCSMLFFAGPGWLTTRESTPVGSHAWAPWLCTSVLFLVVTPVCFAKICSSSSSYLSYYFSDSSSIREGSSHRQSLSNNREI